MFSKVLEGPYISFVARHGYTDPHIPSIFSQTNFTFLLCAEQLDAGSY